MLVAQRGVEFLQCRLDGGDGAQHGIEPLLYRVEAGDRSERAIARAIRLEEIGGSRRCILQLIERGALSIIRANRAFDALHWHAGGMERPVGADLCELIARLRLLLIAEAERVEARLLLVIERVIKSRERRTHEVHGR